MSGCSAYLQQMLLLMLEWSWLELGGSTWAAEETKYQSIDKPLDKLPGMDAAKSPLSAPAIWLLALIYARRSGYQGSSILTSRL